METDNKELGCENDYFFDKNLKNCISCKETCDPYRPATRNECQIHCSAYLHRKNQLTTADAHWLFVTNSEQFQSHTMLFAILCGFVAIVTCCSLFVLLWRRRYQRKGKFENKSVETDDERKYLNFDEVPTSLHRSSKLESSSLCQDFSVSDLKTPIISIEAPPRWDSIPISPKLVSVTQETQADCSDVPTRPKETVSAAMELPNELASAPIDLQEDFDCVEQTYDLARTRQGPDVLLSNFSCDTNGMKNLQISAVLQRLVWVKQFWWDIEGAKVVVDASRQSTAKEDIKKILRREGIPSAEFSFDVICSERDHLRSFGSSSSELRS